MIEWLGLELCPWCGKECEYHDVDVEKDGFIVECKNCGKKIFLCQACFNKVDNPESKCDWQENAEGRWCFRGFIKEGE